MKQNEQTAVALAACDLQAAAVRIGRAPGVGTMADAAEAFEGVWLRWYLLTPEAEPELQRALTEADQLTSALKAALHRAAVISGRQQAPADLLYHEAQQARALLMVSEATGDAIDADIARLAADPLGWTPGFSATGSAL